MPDEAASSPSEEFDRIVADLDLDLGGLDDLDTRAAQLAAQREQAERERALAAAAQEFDDDDSGDEFYRSVGPAHEGVDRHTIAFWAALFAGPIVVMLAAFSAITIPTVIVAGSLLLSVAAVGYLVMKLPGRRSDDDPDNGAAL